MIDAASFRPMTAMEIFSRSVALYRENFMNLVGIAIPGAVIGGFIFQLIWMYQYAEMAGPQVLEAVLPYIAITALFSFVVTAAGVAVISEDFLGKSITVGEAYARVFKVLFPLLGALMLFTIAVFIGLVTFILGIVAYVWFCLASPVVMLEGEGGWGALKRSRVIVKGYFRKVFLVVVLLTIAQVLAAIFLLCVPRFTGEVFGLSSLMSLLSLSVPLFIEPFKILSTTMLYYDLRIRKEGYTLGVMADELAAAA